MAAEQQPQVPPKKSDVMAVLDILAVLNVLENFGTFKNLAN